MLGAQIIARSDTANKDAIGITNLLFGIQQLGKTKVKTKKISPVKKSAILIQIVRPLQIYNEIQALERNYETQIIIAHNDMQPPNSGPRDQPPPGKGLYAQRNAAIPQQTIFPPTLNAEQQLPEIPNVMTKETIKDQMCRWTRKGFNLTPVGKDDEGHYQLGFGPGIQYATDWKKSKQYDLTPSMDEGGNQLLSTFPLVTGQQLIRRLLCQKITSSNQAQFGDAQFEFNQRCLDVPVSDQLQCEIAIKEGIGKYWMQQRAKENLGSGGDGQVLRRLLCETCNDDEVRRGGNFAGRE
ncbi:MAG: hypothetical protein EZS28_033320 [Streblomastix strix]|uniref:Uncharacterized protein n=1 Tax=Streblomastix strix TaxID=222440 RepID=A0A5J4ULK6_9EUKA|nr:MAG: hypothetical protein EZS28_033320 [Streblomastix strix]